MSACSAAFFSKSLTVNDVAFRYQIWDTAGQEKVCSNLLLVLDIFAFFSSRCTSDAELFLFNSFYLPSADVLIL